MDITVSIPDKFIPVAGSDDISRQILEAYAVENYRREEMSLGQLAELLDLSIDEANAFLKERGVPLNYDLHDLDQDLKTIETILNK